MTISIWILAFSWIFPFIGAQTVNSVRWIYPAYSAGGNQVRGQVELFSDRSDWRKACSSNDTLRRSPSAPRLGNLLCRSLGYQLATAITFGRSGTPAPQGRSVDIVSCPDGAADFEECSTVRLDEGTCGIRFFIYIYCSDIIPVALPAPPAGTTETTIDCAANARVLVPLHSSTRLHFARQRISSQCTTALTTMEPGLSFRLKDTPRMDVRPGPPTPCAVINHIIIRQTIQKPFQTEDIEARFCGSPEEPPFQISPLATTVNVTFVAKPPYIGVWEFEILLEAISQLMVDCDPPEVRINLVKGKLFTFAVGTWRASLGYEPARLYDEVLPWCYMYEESSSDMFSMIFPSNCSSHAMANTDGNYTMAYDLLVVGSPVQSGTESAVIEFIERFHIQFQCVMKTAEIAAFITDGQTEDFFGDMDENLSEQLIFPYSVGIFRDDKFQIPADQLLYTGVTTDRSFFLEIKPQEPVPTNRNIQTKVKGCRMIYNASASASSQILADGVLFDGVTSLSVTPSEPNYEKMRLRVAPDIIFAGQPTFTSFTVLCDIEVSARPVDTG